ncbi:unnamed protein product [Peniophora sp. CBMAI 1063]|nr:unnamed protein product [Peniophora sp. CBMAI 1063]
MTCVAWGLTFAYVERQNALPGVGHNGNAWVYEALGHNRINVQLVDGARETGSAVLDTLVPAPGVPFLVNGQQGYVGHRMPWNWRASIANNMNPKLYYFKTRLRRDHGPTTPSEIIPLPHPKAKTVEADRLYFGAQINQYRIMRAL